MNEITGEGTPLEIANAHERAIQLGGPDHVMPDGRTVAETRADLQAQHEIEGAAAAATQLARVREQSIAGDPLYATDTKVFANETGGATIINAAPQSKSLPLPAAPVMKVALPKREIAQSPPLAETDPAK